MQIKRIVYLAASTFLGFLLQLLVHAGLEMWYIDLLLKNFEQWSFGYSWEELWYVHHVLSLFLVFLGIVGGYFLGMNWWRIVYIEKRHWRTRRK